MEADVLCHDLSSFDEQYPATLIPLTFESHGDQLIGRILVAQGAGPHPTILLLHGFPGNEQSGDLAHIFRRAGWNVMSFHYRGAWGSEGAFSYTHSFEDVPAALRMLKTEQMQEQCRVDPEQIVLIGHSMGGFAALFTAATDPSIRAVASLAGFHLGRFAQELRQDPLLVESTASDWDSSLAALRGTTGAQLVQEVLDHAEQWTLNHYMDRLAQCSIFLIGGSRDTVAPLHVHHTPLIAALEQYSASHPSPTNATLPQIGARTPAISSTILPADHAFSDARVALAQHLLTWLEKVKHADGSK
ncbi:alpha/beta fold hydrolase [Ktedonosporobacter rubrisoli]|uniref:Alpha/beta fold hydrolase n=1 Tax=Ktedonosporobacter rubrisoli TaxID=2509675 RepID=A0A4V0YZS5_KTERU|nr:alpha/beta fold hydrolase [Ktedonosporobacter rubrisoli]QBD80741.1 alpha/beta fold hydrolase [Ktedonosporobacter rubrisoli]